MVKTADGNVVGEWYPVPDEPTESQTILPESAFYISAHALKRLENYTKDTPYTIPQGYFFAMGDNRDQSHDSRYQDMGDIPYQNLFGEVM
jgi:signal peptidase I